MATLIKADGTRQENFTELTLSGLQQAVDGYIEIVYLPNGEGLVVNDNGLNESLSHNTEASHLAGMVIVGDAVLLTKKELREDV